MEKLYSMIAILDGGEIRGVVSGKDEYDAIRKFKDEHRSYSIRSVTAAEVKAKAKKDRS